MSISERMSQIHDAQQAAIREQREREATSERERHQELNRIQEEKMARYKELLPEALSRQQDLLSELRGLGIIPLIEEIAGKVHDPQPQDTEDHPHTIEDINWPTLEESEEYSKLRWHAYTPPPAQAENGTPIADLVIDIAEDPFLAPRMPNQTRLRSRKVNLTYREDRTLIIKGAQTTFESAIDPSDLSQLPQYEDALAHAFLNPQHPPTSVNPPHFDTSGRM